MSIATSPKIPADLEAEVRSVSAVGEQYVDLRPRTDSGPYLQNGAVKPETLSAAGDNRGLILQLHGFLLKTNNSLAYGNITSAAGIGE